MASLRRCVVVIALAAAVPVIAGGQAAGADTRPLTPRGLGNVVAFATLLGYGSATFIRAIRPRARTGMPSRWTGSGPWKARRPWTPSGNSSTGCSVPLLHRCPCSP